MGRKERVWPQLELHLEKMVRFTQIMKSSVEFATRQNARIVTLNRPKALNALNHEMVKEMRPQLKQWEEQEFACAIIKGIKGDYLIFTISSID